MPNRYPMICAGWPPLTGSPPVTATSAASRCRSTPMWSIRVLGLLDVEAGTETDRRRELARLAERDRAGVMRADDRRAAERAPPAAAGGRVADRARTARGSRCATSCPATCRRAGTGCTRATARRSTVVAAPPQVPQAPATWGWMLQLYALRSARSWGIGDLGDLREFVDWTASEHGAGAVLLNPLHAPGPDPPGAALALHAVQPAVRQPARAAHRGPRRLPPSRPGHPRRGRRAAVSASTARGSTTTWCGRPNARRWSCCGAPRAGPSRSATRRDGAAATGPPTARSPSGTAAGGAAGRRRCATSAAPAVAAARRELAPRVAFHAWVQQRCAEQLTAVRDAAQDAGMALGVVHDLAVGCRRRRRRRLGAGRRPRHRRAASARRRTTSPSAARTGGCRRGARTGWPPPATPRYATCCARCSRHADGLRIDHVAGLWRLWWVPPGDGPDRGTYVHYDAEAMLAVLALEAHRAGATVVGEDLGTVEPEVTEALADNEMLGCAVLWFTRDQAAPGEPLLPPDEWPPRAAASLSTHDLPTAAGFLRGEHVRARADLGLLDDVRGRAGHRRAANALSGWRCCASEGLVPRGRRCGRTRRSGDHRRDAPLLASTPSRAQADLALRRDRRAAAAEPARAPSTSTRTGGCRCR